MNFILNHPLVDGNTPITLEDVEDLIPQISTMAELNEYEALNILEAQQWAFGARVMAANDPFEERYVRLLHKKMFDQVWGWAGVYRRRPVLFGRDAHEIVQLVPQLLANTKYQLEHHVFPVDECLVRFHHGLVTIHPFPNGNGRHSRMMTDVLAVKYRQPIFTWGAGADLAAEGAGHDAYMVALRALDQNVNEVQPLLAFARS
jgi:Fic-DOC domain mobile mystery protein B